MTTDKYGYPTKEGNVTQGINLGKCFLTGGAGFIGSHLGDRLLKEGNEVTVYDNLSSGKLENIKQNMKDKNFHFIKADMLDFETLKQSMQGHDLIWHLGANTDIPGGIRDTEMDLKNCIIATHNVLEAMRQNGIMKLIFSSTSAVYGDTPPIPLVETYGPLLPISLYGAGKLACEGQISAFCHLFDMQAWIFRFGNVMGGHMTHGIIYDFIHKLRRNPKELEILGDGNQDKNYFLVEDCIDGMLWAFQQSNNQCGVFNLGGDSSIKATDIAKIVVEEMGLKNVKFKYTGGARGWPGDVPVVLYNLGKIKQLGWVDSHSVEEVIRITTRRLIETT
jgi:UDP-glucose 4-epimerase